MQTSHLRRRTLRLYVIWRRHILHALRSIFWWVRACMRPGYAQVERPVVEWVGWADTALLYISMACYVCGILHLRQFIYCNNIDYSRKGRTVVTVLITSDCVTKLPSQWGQMCYPLLGKHATQYVRTLSTPQTYVVYPGAYPGALSYARLLLGN